MSRIQLGTGERGNPVFLSERARATHMQVVGASGTGKTKFLEHLIREDILAGNGLCLIDPTGNLYHDLLAWCETRGESRTTSTSRGETEGQSEGLVPILTILPTAVFSLEEQRHRKAAFLRNLRRQEAVVKVPERPSVAFRTTKVEPGVANPERVARFKRETFRRSSFAKPTRAVDALLRARRASLERAADAGPAGTKAPPQNPDDFLE